MISREEFSKPLIYTLILCVGVFIYLALKSRKPKIVDFSNAKIGFIGAGKLTETLIQRLITYGKVEASRLHVSAPSTKNLERLKHQFSGLHVSKRNIDIFGKYDCDIVFVAVHGSVIKNCYKHEGQRPAPLTTDFIPILKHPLYILSLVCGYDLNSIKACLLNPKHPKKYMPEMHRIMFFQLLEGRDGSCAYDLGVCAIDCEPDSKKLAEPLRTMLSSVAKLEYVPEFQMDAASAVCGAGLAFSYYFIQALADGAFKMGLSREMSNKFAAKTVQSATQVMLESGKHPIELRDEVCSPSGAAIYGIHILDKSGVKSGVVEAVEAAHKRADELAATQPILMPQTNANQNQTPTLSIIHRPVQQMPRINAILDEY
jgi:pyrroline-5-carboxylate reductase